MFGRARGLAGPANVECAVLNAGNNLAPASEKLIDRPGLAWYSGAEGRQTRCNELSKAVPRSWGLIKGPT